MRSEQQIRDAVGLITRMRGLLQQRGKAVDVDAAERLKAPLDVLSWILQDGTPAEFSGLLETSEEAEQQIKWIDSMRAKLDKHK